MNIKYKPSSFVIYGLGIFFLMYFFSPFEYHIYSFEGAIYFFMAFFFLFAGIKLMEVKVIGKSNEYNVIITKKAEIVLITIMLLSCLFFIIFIKNIISLLPIYRFANEDLRAKLSESRPFVTKVAEIVIKMGPACYLIISRVGQCKYRYTKLFSYICFFFPIISILAIGARSSAVIGIFLLIVNELQLNKSSKYFIKKKTYWQRIKKIIIVCSLFIIGYFIYSLFSSRQVDSGSQYLFIPGDCRIKNFYNELNVNNSLNPLYNSMFYYTHSFPVFTYFYTKEIPTNPFIYQFSFITVVLEGLHLLDKGPMHVAKQLPTSGLFATFIPMYISDYGKILALLAIFLTGIIFGWGYWSSTKAGIGFFILSPILIQLFVSPIYFWNVGGIDYIILWTVIIYFLLKFFGIRISIKSK